MKLFLSLLCCGLLWVSSASAQDKEKVVKQLSDAACECINRKHKEAKDPQSLSMESLMESCVVEAFLENIELIMAETPDILSDEEAGEKLGMEIGMRLLKDCKTLMEVAKNSAFPLQELTEDTAPRSVGTFKKVENKGYQYLVLLADGKEERFAILQKFEGHEQLLGQEKSLSGKKISITWEEQDLYQSKSKSFVKQKVLLSFRLD